MKQVLSVIALFILTVSCDQYSAWNDIIYTSCGPNHKCVPPYLCNDGKINSEGSKLVVPRSDTCDNIEVCCALEDEVNDSIFGPKPLPPGCGYRNPNGINYKLTGATNEAEFAEFPWMMAIYINGNTYLCGGSLLHPQVVLTVAHHVFNKHASNLIVRAGEWDRNGENEPLPHQDRRVRRIIYHKNFVRSTFENNVALLILKTSFDLSSHISPVCLPPVGYNSDNVDCFVAGWGKKEYTSRKYANILKKISLKVVPKTRCEANLQRTVLGPTFRLKPCQICAGGEAGKDSCTGDGGSALVCPLRGNENRYYQAGIVSAGIGCGQQDVPGVYSSTSYLLPWIENEFRVKNFNLTYLP